MRNIKFAVTMLCTLLLVTGMEARSRRHASRKHYRTVRYARNKAPQKNVRKAPDRTFQIEDSMLNAPTQPIQTKILISDKDIPNIYVTKLDSTLHLYETELDQRIMPCANDSNFVGVKLTDSLYIQRLQQIPSIMELTYNNIVRDYIELYTIRKHRLTSYILGQSDYYFPMFDDALEAEGIPQELKYLPVIESSLNPIAYSPAGASGLWQFIASTGKMYGLTINSLVDERRDPIKASKAAARYLKHLYGIYHDWTLVIAAYNCGPGNVNKAIRRAGNEHDYWAIYNYLPKETRGYVPAFIAATYTMHYYKEHNICPAIVTRPLALDTIQVRDRVHLKQIAAVLNINIKDLRIMNPQYRHDVIPGNGVPYTLCLPINKINQYEMYKNTILAYQVPNYTPPRARVEPGGELLAANKSKKDSVSTIADTTKQQLVADNSAKEKEKVEQAKIEEKQNQQALRLAQRQRANRLRNERLAKEKAEKEKAEKEELAQQEEQSQEEEKAAKRKSRHNSELLASNEESKAKGEKQDNTDEEGYRVRPGDTLYSIASKNKVTVVKLRKWNSLKSDDLKIGQTIVVKRKSNR